MSSFSIPRRPKPHTAALTLTLLLALAALFTSLIPAVHADPNPKPNYKEEYEQAEPLIHFIEQAEFANTVKDPTNGAGTWFVFFGAYWCPHCQRLTPKWLKLQKAAETDPELKGLLHVKKVECTRNEDLCEGDEVIEGYPTLKLYQNGKFVEEFPQQLSLTAETLIDYAKSKVLALSNATTARDGNQPAKSSGASSSTDLDNAMKDLRALVSKYSKPGPRVNPEGKVVHLTDKTFPVLTNNSAWFVMFHAPWCGHCQHLAPTWEALAGVMKGKLNIGKVDCTVESVTTQKFGIRGFPTLKFIDGDMISEFRGPRTLEALQEFAESFMKVPFEAVTASEIAKLQKSKEVAFFYLYDAKTRYMDALELFMDVSKSLRSSASFYISPDPAAFSLLKATPSKSPALVCVKDFGRDTYVYDGSLVSMGESTKQQISDWVIRNKHPLLPQLDSHNSEEILGSDKVVALAIVDAKLQMQTDGIKEAMRMAARKWSNGLGGNAGKKFAKGAADDVIFAWLDGVKWAQYVGRVYGLQGKDLPALIVANPKDDEFYDVDSEGRALRLEADAVVATVEDVLAGKLKPKYTSGWFIATMKWIFKPLAPIGTFISQHPIVSMIIMVVGLFALVWWLTQDSPGGAGYGPVPKRDPKAE
ncbi:hypothetical protein HK102_010427 [Quaeritorhiza haematococci]|nr:hypothetical protein HK102_010427 [Quaeritorhiza haematococci]